MSEYKISRGNLYIIIDDVMRVRVPKVLEDYKEFLQYSYQQYEKDGCVCFEFNSNIIQTRKHLQFTISPFVARQAGLKKGDILLCELANDFYGFRLKKVDSIFSKE